jgi:hypothetical protein
MMDLPTLRKADIFSGAAITLLGLFIISQAIKMPMKDSWGGVQNVWFVSPALFPLLVGGMLIFLGIVLMVVALRTVGSEGLSAFFSYLCSSSFADFLKNQDTIKFYAIVLNLLSLVFIMVPRVDFFLAATFFLLMCFFMFYCADFRNLLRMLGFAILVVLLLCSSIYFQLDERLAALTDYGVDWLVLLFMPILCLLGWLAVKDRREKRRKYRISLVVGLLAPLIIGMIFKYFLLVPMPHEGLIVQLLDSIWYAELWS